MSIKRTRLYVDTHYRNNAIVAEATFVTSLRPRTLWDKLLRREKYDYAVSYCSPADFANKDVYDPNIGKELAEKRLEVYKKGRTSLSDRGLAGTISARKGEAFTFLVEMRVESDAPYGLWYRQDRERVVQMRDEIMTNLHIHDFRDKAVKSRELDLYTISSAICLISAECLEKFHAWVFGKALPPTARKARKKLFEIAEEELGANEVKLTIDEQLV